MVNLPYPIKAGIIATFVPYQRRFTVPGVPDSTTTIVVFGAHPNAKGSPDCIYVDVRSVLEALGREWHGWAHPDVVRSKELTRLLGRGHEADNLLYTLSNDHGLTVDE